MSEPRRCDFDMPDPEMIEIYRRMDPTARVAAGLLMTKMERQHLIATIRRLHPSWSEDEVHAAFTKEWLQRAEDI